MIAVVADDDRTVVRVGLENRFVNRLRMAGQTAWSTAGSFPDLAAARSNKDATLARLRGEGADAILITRLVSRSSHMARMQQELTGQYVGVTVIPGPERWDASIGTYATYNSSIRADDRTCLLLDTSLYDLLTGKRIWACVTETTIKETDDRLEIADEFVNRIIGLMRQDSVIH